MLAGDGMRVCNVPGCFELQPEPRCPAHRREREQRRGTRQERGYDAKHQALRARWSPRVASGKVQCWRCGQRLSPLEPWDLGHVDTEDLPREKQRRLPECLPCNRATASR